MDFTANRNLEAAAITDLALEKGVPVAGKCKKPTPFGIGFLSAPYPPPNDEGRKRRAISNLHFTIYNGWYPQGESNPYYKLEKLVS